MAFVRYSSLSKITESGNGTTGWIYTSDGTGDHTNTFAGGESVSLSGNFTVTFVLTSTGGEACGIDSTSTGQDPFFWTIGIHNSGANYALFSGTPDATIACNNGDWARFVRTGSTLVISISSNSGASWSTLHTVTGFTTATVWSPLAFNVGPLSIGPITVPDNALVGATARPPLVRGRADRLAPPFWPPSEVARPTERAAYVAPVPAPAGVRNVRAPGALQRGVPPFWPPSEVAKATDPPAYVAPVPMADGLRGVRAPGQLGRALPPFWPPSETQRATTTPATAYVAPVPVPDGVRNVRAPLGLNRALPPFWPPTEAPRAMTGPQIAPAPGVVYSRPRFEPRRDRRRVR